MTATATKLIRAALFGALLAFAEYLFLGSRHGQQLEFRLLDTWFSVRGPTSPPDDLVIVALDEESYRNLQVPMSAPWPRALHGRLLQKLSEAGAKVAVFDILFLGPSSPEGDAELAEGFRVMPSIIGAELGTTEDGDFRQETVRLPYDLFRSLTTIGLIGTPLTDGTARLIPRYDSELTATIPPLPLAAARATTPDALQPSHDALINYFGNARTIKTYSYYQILDPTAPFPASELRGKTVFIGLSLKTGTGADKKDAFLTPFARRGLTYGVEIHATATANLRDRAWIDQMRDTRGRYVVATITFLAGMLLMTLPPLWGSLALLGGSTLWLVLSYQLFLNRFFFPGATAALIVLPAAFLIGTVFQYLSARRERLKLMRAFELYISPEMAREVARSPEALGLGGELVTATALFTDIEGFTRLTESMPPASTAAMLNSYFTEVMEAIFQKRGTLIKFIGDAVFALWGAPIKVKDHAQRTFEAGTAIMREVARFNQSGRFPKLHTRIGINTGPMLVGNLGAVKRFDFTAIGDSVNLASRVEGMNKYLGTTLLMTGSTYKALQNTSGLLPFGRFKVSGKEESIELFGLFSEQPPLHDTERFAAAVRAFQSRDIPAARSELESLAAGTGPYKSAASLYIRELPSALNPHAQWDGSVRIESK